GIVADDHGRQVVEILHCSEIEDGIGSVAYEDHDVGLQRLELNNLSRNVRAVGVVRDLCGNIDVRGFGGFENTGRDRSAAGGVLVDDRDFIDLFAGLFQICEKTGIGLGEIGGDRTA